VDDDKIKVIAINVCREYYADKADSRRQEVRDMQDELLGVSGSIHIHHHNDLSECKRTKNIAKDSVTRKISTGFVSILGWLILAAFSAWELKP